jgi:hypothetical protein
MYKFTALALPTRSIQGFFDVAIGHIKISVITRPSLLTSYDDFFLRLHSDKTSMLDALSLISGISGSVLYEFLFCSGKGGYGISAKEKHKKLKENFGCNILFRRDFLFTPSLFSGAGLSGKNRTRVRILFVNESASAKKQPHK